MNPNPLSPFFTITTDSNLSLLFSLLPFLRLSYPYISVVAKLPDQHHSLGDKFYVETLFSANSLPPSIKRQLNSQAFYFSYSHPQTFTGFSLVSLTSLLQMGIFQSTETGKVGGMGRLREDSRLYRLVDMHGGGDLIPWMRLHYSKLI